MPAINVVRVFISYARKDAAALAQQLYDSLVQAGLEPWLDKSRIDGGAVWTEEIEHEIDTCDVALALLSPGSYQSDICRAEQLRALRRGKRVIPILARPGTDIPLHLEASNYRDFTGDTTQAFGQLLSDIENRREGVALRPEFRDTYVTAPPLPRNYLPRPDALRALRDKLLTDDSGPGIALTALKGMGGIGKTVLAQALCHDEVVQHAFPDGILWITAGKQPAGDLVTRLREIGKGLKDDLTGYDSEIGSINCYRTILRRKAALIIVDDVWTARDVEPFLAESPGSRLLFTTRDGSLAGDLGAELVIAGLLTAAQSRNLLANWARLRPEALPSEAASLIDECGGLPLALAMVGAMLRDKPPSHWSHVLELLRNADLAKIHAQFPDYPHSDLLRAIQVSVDALAQPARARYLALAVLLEDMPIVPVIQQALWNTDDFDCLETAEQFVSLSLAQRDEESGGFRVHDLQLDYLRAQYPDKESLELIHGAVQISSNVIARDPSQFVSQLAARLLPYQANAGIQQFTSSLVTAARQSAAGGRTWLRALQPAIHPPGTALLRTLQGHFLPVRAVAVSPDGRSALSGSEDNLLKLWDLATGRELRSFQGHSGWVSDVAFTPDASCPVSASEDATLRLWNLSTGAEVRSFIGHSGRVNAVAVSPDGKRAVSASDDHTLKLWELETGREISTLAGHSGPVNGVALTADGLCAVSASDDRTLIVWELEAARKLRTLEGHSAAVIGVAVSPRGRAVSAGEDCVLKVWDLAAGSELLMLQGHSGTVNGVAISPDGLRAISASDDHTLKLWDLETGDNLRTIEGHTAWITDVAFTPDGRRAVSASYDNTLKLWDPETGREPSLQEGHSESVSSVIVTPDTRRAVSASFDKTLKVWDPQTGCELHRLGGHSGAIACVALSADGKRAVSGSLDRTLKLWDLEAGSELRTLDGHSCAVTAAVLSPDARWALSGSFDGALRLWNLESGRELHAFDAHRHSVTALVLSRDGRYAVSASADTKLKLWDIENGCELHTLEGHSLPVTAVALRSDGKRAMSASYDKTIKLWDLATGNELRSFLGHSEAVIGVAFTPDGQHAVSASFDKTLKLWDVETGRRLQEFKGHSSAITGLAVSPDGRHAVSVCYDKTVKVWDLGSPKPLATFTADASFHCCAFAGPRTIIAGDVAGSVHFLALESAQTASAAG